MKHYLGLIMIVGLLAMSPAFTQPIQADSEYRTAIEQELQVLDKEFEELIKQLDKDTQESLKAMYNKQKKSVLDDFEKKTKETLQKGLKSIFRKNKSVAGYTLTRKYMKVEKKFTDMLTIAEKLASGEGVGAVAWSTFEDQYQKDVLDAATSFFPAIKPIYSMLRFAHTEYEALLKEIHDSSAKGLVSQMVADEQLHKLTGKLLEDHLLQSYIKFGKTLDKGIALTKDKNNPVQFQDIEQHNIMTIRFFMEKYGKEFTRYKHVHKLIGYKAGVPLHRQQDAVVFVMRQFYQSKVRPIVLNKQQAKKEQKKLIGKMKKSQEILSAIQKGKADLKTANEASALLKEWMKKVLPKYKGSSVKVKPVLGKKTIKDISDKETRIAVNAAYGKKFSELNAILDTFIESYSAVPKGVEKGGRWFYYPSGYLNDLKYQAFKEHGVDLKMTYSKEQGYIWASKPIIFESMPSIEAVVNAVDASLSMPFDKTTSRTPIKSNRVNTVLLRETIDDAQRFYKTYQWILESHYKTILEFPGRIQSDEEAIQNISYLGYVEKDKLLAKQKQEKFDRYKMYSNKIQVAISMVEDRLAEIRQIEDSLQENLWAISDYEEDMDALDMYLSRFNQSVETVEKFTVNLSNSDDYNIYAKDYIAAIDTVYRESKPLYEFNNDVYPFEDDFIDGIKNDSMGWLDKQYGLLVNRYYSELNARVDTMRNVNPSREYKTLSKNKTLDTFNYPLFENRPLDMTQDEVDKKRRDYEDRLLRWFDRAEKESEQIQVYSDNWSKEKDAIKSKQQKIESQRHNKSINTRVRQVQVNQAIVSANQTVQDLNDMMAEFKLKKKALLEQMKEAKARQAKVDAREKKRISAERSQLRFVELTHIYTRQQQRYDAIKNSQSYYSVYLKKDMGRAKAMLLYFTKVKLLAESDHNDAEKTYLKGFVASDSSKADDMFLSESELVMQIIGMQANMVAQLRERLVTVDELLESALFVDTDTSYQAIINGTLDSDRDGIADHVELEKSNSPIYGQSIIDYKTVTIPFNGSISFNSAKSGHVMSFATYWFPQAVDTIHTSYFQYLGTNANVSIPVSGYTGAYFILDLSPGRVYAIDFLDGFYAKIQIMSYVPSTSIQLRYWYKTDGGVF